MQSRITTNAWFIKAASGVLFCSAAILYPAQTTAQESKADTISACEEAARLLEADDIDGALDEAEWCREGLLQMKQSQTLAVFPDDVGGFTGGEVTKDSLLGMVTIGRQYENGSKKLDLQLVSGGVAGLGSLGQLFNSLGTLAGSGNEKLRIQRRTVLNSSDNINTSLTVTLKSGGMLSVKSDTVSSDEAIEFLRAFPIKELDEALEQ